MKHLLLLLGLGLAMTANAQRTAVGAAASYGEGGIGVSASYSQIDGLGGEISFKTDIAEKLNYGGLMATYELPITFIDFAYYNDIKIVVGLGAEAGQVLYSGKTYDINTTNNGIAKELEVHPTGKIGVNVKNIQASVSYGVSGFNVGVGYIFKL